MTNSTVDRKKRIASIFQHYYPEGGWGVVLLLAVIMVQIIIHGLLLSYGVLLAKVVRRFQVSLLESGQKSDVTPEYRIMLQYAVEIKNLHRIL